MHCQLQSLNATTAAGDTLPFCGLELPASSPPSTAAAAAAAVAAAPAPDADETEAAAAAAGSSLRGGYGPCRANGVASLNVTSGTDYLSLHPGLRFPNIQVGREKIDSDYRGGVALSLEFLPASFL